MISDIQSFLYESTQEVRIFAQFKFLIKLLNTHGTVISMGIFIPSVLFNYVDLSISTSTGLGMVGIYLEFHI